MYRASTVVCFRFDLVILLLKFTNFYVLTLIGKEFQNRGKTLRHERHNCAAKSVKKAISSAIDPHQFHCKVIVKST